MITAKDLRHFNFYDPLQFSAGLLLRQKVFFFSPQSVHRPYQNSGHTGGSFFFTPIWAKTVPKFRTCRRVSFFHQNFEKEIPYEKETPFENISNLALSLQLGLGQSFVIASREANDSVVPLTCLQLFFPGVIKWQNIYRCHCEIEKEVDFNISYYVNPFYIEHF